MIPVKKKEYKIENLLYHNGEDLESQNNLLYCVYWKFSIHNTSYLENLFYK